MFGAPAHSRFMCFVLTKLHKTTTVAERDTTEIMYRHATPWSSVAAVEKLAHAEITNEHVVQVLQKVADGTHTQEEVQQLITHFVTQ